jgi:zinc protease
MRTLRSFAAFLAATLLALVPSFAAAKEAQPPKAAAKPAAEATQPPAYRVKLGPPIPVSAIKKVTEVEGITEYVLPNGLKVLLFPDASKPTVVVNITYKVGSRFENYGETGMAHLLEHLMFKGTPRHPHIDQEYNKRGVKFNGTTWLDRTNYYEIFQASDDNLAWAIGLEADRMVSSFISRKDLDSEMTVVRNEYESGENSPGSVLLKRMQSVAYDWHAYGRPTIGNKSDIENVDIPHLQAFYHLYYQPDNAVLLVAGKFDPQKALADIAKSFGPVPKPNVKRPVFWTVEPTQDGDREFTVRRKGDVQIIAMGYHVPSSLHPDADALSFAGFTLSQVPTGRLHKALVEKGLASQVFSYPLMGHDPGLQIFGAVVKKDQPIGPVKEAMEKAIEGFGDAPPTADEMDRARISMLNDVDRTLANHESLGLELSEYIALGDWRLFFYGRDRVSQVKPEDVQRVAKAYYKRDNRTVGIFLPEDAPERAIVPSTPAVSEVMKDFKASAKGAEAEAFDPSQDNIDRRTKIVQVGPVKVALLAKKNRGETVHVAINLHIGNVQALAGQRTNASFAGSMLSRGTVRLTRAEFSDALEKLKVAGSVGGPDVQFQTTGPNLEGALALIAEALKSPRFDPAEFEQLRTQRVTAIMASMSEPGPRAGNALAQVFNIYPEGDWRHTPTLEQQLERVRGVKLDDARRFHDEFYGADPADIAIVGDFDEAKAEAQLKALFAGWEPKVKFEQVTREHRDIPATEKSIETPDKANAVFLARENIDMRDDDPDYVALYVADYMFGGGAGFDSRLMLRIRQKEGLSYGVGSGLDVSSIDRASSWTVFAISAPQNTEKVEKAFREELARALKDGFTQAELDAAKSGLLQSRLQNRSQDGVLAAGWAEYLYLGRTWQFSKSIDAKIKALTLDQVNAAFRKHIDPAKVTVVKAGDFSKK